jgi:hypothetical protein
MTQHFRTVTCRWCNAALPMDEAIDAGWVPSFWSGGEEVDEPSCAACAPKYLWFNEELGDFELKADPPTIVQQ